MLADTGEYARGRADLKNQLMRLLDQANEFFEDAVMGGDEAYRAMVMMTWNHQVIKLLKEL